MITPTRIKKFAQALVVLLLAGIFIGLGNWQLDRAHEQKLIDAQVESQDEVRDQRVYLLGDVTTPTGALPVDAFGKFVSTSGNYIATYKVPNQSSADGSIDDWEVALMQIDPESAILVLRGLWSDRLSSPDIVMSSRFEISGRIYPTQVEDRAITTESQLSRIDPALLTSITDLQLYDGFISASAESHRGEEVLRQRLEISLPKGEFTGYYWQHISYVVIWWLMAAMVLWAPFYKRREEQ